MVTYMCDFETNTKADNCSVWAVGVYNLDTKEFECGKSIEYLFEKITECGSCKTYFHNLKFDGAFILDWLFRNGYTHVEGWKTKLKEKEFKTIISDKNMFYAFKIKYKKNITIGIYDSLKIIPFRVKEISKAFGLKKEKGEIDYHIYRSEKHNITDEEYKYIRNDCEIVGESLNILFSQGLKKMTQGSNALDNFKKTLPNKFEKIFPPLSPTVDEELRPAYRGGVAYVNPRFKGIDIGKGTVYDKNSMYPWAMKTQLMPYGEEIHYEGKYVEDKLYPLYIQKIRCMFTIKPDHMPMIQIKSGYGGFVPTEYVESSGDEEVTLTLTSVDLKLFLDQYDVHYIEYVEGWKFKGTIGLFDNYINYWYEVKEKASRENNKGMRTLAKLMLNALYGKFATSLEVVSKIPYYSHDEQKVKYRSSEPESKEGIYLPLACFITSYARNDLVRGIQKNFKNFIYCDTDSMHFKGTGEPLGIEIDDYKLGAWSLETRFLRARFLRAKCYIEEVQESLKKPTKQYRPYLKLRKLNKRLKPLLKLKVTCAGMPYECHKHVTWENFNYRVKYEGKKRFKVVPIGAILVDTPFEIKIA